MLLQLHTKHIALRDLNTERYKERRIYTKKCLMWNKRVCLNVAGRDSRVEVTGAGKGKGRGCERECGCGSRVNINHQI